jgi:hypothetical protein
MMQSWLQLAIGAFAASAGIVAFVYARFLAYRTGQEITRADRGYAAAASRTHEEPPPNANSHIFAVQLLLVRFALLYVVLVAWSFIAEAYAFGLSFFRGEFALSWTYLVLKYLPSIGELAIFVIIGWPIFVEANALAGIDVRRLSPFWKPQPDDFDDDPDAAD